MITSRGKRVNKINFPMKYPRMGLIILLKSTVIRYPITIKIQQMKIITTFRRLSLLHFRQYIRGMNRAKSIKAIGNIPRLSDIFTPLCEYINPFWKGFGGLNITTISRTFYSYNLPKWS